MGKIFNVLKEAIKLSWDKMDKNKVSNLILMVNPFIVILLSSKIDTIKLILIAVFIIIISLLFRIFNMIDKKENGIPIPIKNYVKRKGNKITIDECDIYPLIVYFDELYEYLEREGLTNGK